MTKYVVLVQYQNTSVLDIATAEFDGIGWCNCSADGQPQVIQYLSLGSGKFEDGRPVLVEEPKNYSLVVGNYLTTL